MVLSKIVFYLLQDGYINPRINDTRGPETFAFTRQARAVAGRPGRGVADSAFN